MKCVKLPVVYPTITTLPPYADTLAILQCHDESLGWVFSHYIQTVIVEVLEGKEENYQSFMPCFFCDFDRRRIVNTVADCIFLNRETNPYLNIFETPNSIIELSGETYVSYIKKALDLSMYVYAYCDISKIDDYNRKERTAHEIFIYGYDDDKGGFFYGDFLNTPDSKYKFSFCTYADVENALICVKDFSIPVVKSIALVQFVENGPFIFDYSYIKDSISDYLYPDKEDLRRLECYINSFVNTGVFGWITKAYLGTGVYDYFSNIEQHIIDGRIDLRLIHALYDHKKMMVQRLEFLLRAGYIPEHRCNEIESYRKLANDAMIIRNKILKYNITGKKEIITKIPSQINEIREKEKLLLETVFQLC